MVVVSPTGTLFEGDIDNVSFPGQMGAFAVYPRHAPIISALSAGNIIYTRGGKEDNIISISGGFVEVKDNVITVAAIAKKEKRT